MHILGSASASGKCFSVHNPHHSVLHYPAKPPHKFDQRIYTHLHTCRTCRSAFKTYVKKIVNRRNSITGVLYRDDPTIMAWDLANEPYVLGDASGDILKVCMQQVLPCRS